MKKLIVLGLLATLAVLSLATLACDSDNKKGDVKPPDLYNFRTWGKVEANTGGLAVYGILVTWRTDDFYESYPRVQSDNAGITPTADLKSAGLPNSLYVIARCNQVQCAEYADFAGPIPALLQEHPYSGDGGYFTLIRLSPATSADPEQLQMHFEADKHFGYCNRPGWHSVSSIARERIEQGIQNGTIPADWAVSR